MYCKLNAIFFIRMESKHNQIKFWQSVKLQQNYKRIRAESEQNLNRSRPKIWAKSEQNQKRRQNSIIAEFKFYTWAVERCEVTYHSSKQCHNYPLHCVQRAAFNHHQHHKAQTVRAMMMPWWPWKLSFFDSFCFFLPSSSSLKSLWWQ